MKNRSRKLRLSGLYALLIAAINGYLGVTGLLAVFQGQASALIAVLSLVNIIVTAGTLLLACLAFSEASSAREQVPSKA